MASAACTGSCSSSEPSTWVPAASDPAEFAPYTTTTTPGSRSITFKCPRCSKVTNAKKVLTFTKPIEVCDKEASCSDELVDGNYVVKVSFEVVVERKSFVKCSHCEEPVRITNEAIDDDFGEIMGDAIATDIACEEDYDGGAGFMAKLEKAILEDVNVTAVKSRIEEEDCKKCSKKRRKDEQH